MTLHLSESAAALQAILALPDPPEMQHRGHVLTYHGKPDVQMWWHQNLPRIYVQHMRKPIEPDEDFTRVDSFPVLAAWGSTASE